MEKLDRLDELIDGAEELLTQLADAHDPRIQLLRERVDQAVADATRHFSRQGEDPSARFRNMAGTIDGCVRDYPWLALLTGVLVAGIAGYIAGTAGRRRA
ncbi:MAG TPA: hypothetical protein VKP66_13460 [Steroidobacteraceae bacterium]|nr:hypothetical protein [Steroidobacteraceae bacterium]